jgi:hypothetical protein
MKVLLTIIFVSTLVTVARAQSTSDVAELTRILNEFLKGAAQNDGQIHGRFWAEDLIYTGSSGRRVGKSDIMRELKSAPPRKAEDPTISYSAEDVRIRQFGNTAIVAFRLVGTTSAQGKTYVAQYLNTGTFLKRDGKWQAVSWQATRLSAPEEERRKQVEATEASFHQLILAGDVRSLEALVDKSFIWTHTAGEQISRDQLFEQLRTGQLKYSKLEIRDVAISLYGDMAVVRGVSDRQRTAIPGSSGGRPDPAPLDVFYTLTFINEAGAWKAVALHTSRANAPARTP